MLATKHLLQSVGKGSICHVFRSVGIYDLENSIVSAGQNKRREARESDEQDAPGERQDGSHGDVTVEVQARREIL